MNQRSRFLLVAGIISIAGALTLTQRGTTEGPDTAIQAPKISTDQAGTPGLPAHNLSQQNVPELPPELVGLEPKGALSVDANHHLVPDENLRNLFDFHLANLDREPMDLVLNRIRATLANRLGEPARSQALALLNDYVNYRLALTRIDQNLPPDFDHDGFDLNALTLRQKALLAARAEHFTPQTHAAFFGEDEQLDNYTLERLTIERNEALTEQQKAQQLAQLEHALPEHIQRTRARATINSNLFEKTEAMRSNGATDADIFQLRAQNLGETAAANLAELDLQQQQWQSRLDHYRQEKARITNANLSPEDQRNAVSELQQRLFEGPERLRVRALDADSRRYPIANHPE